MERANEILDFWFGPLSDTAEYLATRNKVWFEKSRDTDRMIRERFEQDVIKAASGDYDHWARDNRGLLAGVILLDQFSRNIYRETPQAFAQDEKARSLVIPALDEGRDSELHFLERPFVYLPLEHAEDLELQNRSVALFERLLNECPDQLKKAAESYLDYAIRHQKIISRFGRFPHRNKILGRLSTPEEIEFLKLPGSSF